MKFTIQIALFLFCFLSLIGLCSWMVIRAGAMFGVLQGAAALRAAALVAILLPTTLVITMALYGKMHNAFLSFIYLIDVIWLPTLLYLSMGAILLFALFGISKIGNVALPMYTLAWCVVALSGLAVTYGIYNATHIRTVMRTIEAPTLSQNWQGKNIILVSDTHLGIVRSKHFMEKVVRKINDAKPDVVLIAGDIIDGPHFNYEEGLAPLENINAPLGVYYTPGNHEGYNTEPEKFYPVIENHTTMLRDSITEINGTQIIGLDFKTEGIAETKSRLEHMGYEKTKPSIVIMHDPKNIAALQQEGVSLAVSGHTHCGQFFPINLIVKSIYKEYAYGVNKVGNTTSVTTCGVGTAMSPLRLGTNPEIVVLKIQ